MFFQLGPFLHIGGNVYDSVLLPYGWLEKIPGLGIMRAPIRFHLMTYLGVCLFYGAAAASLARNRRLLTAGSLGLLVLVESLSLPLLTAERDVSPFYSQLRDDSNNSAVIDLHYNSRALYYQTVHEKKIMGLPGILSRQPNYALSFLWETPGPSKSSCRKIRSDLWPTAGGLRLPKTPDRRWVGIARLF